ncbi:hypothetical protein ACO2Q0_07450 [Phenylobacterium sp. VNQ135]|uniref:hypothetical protein n=1 Tax=Phenylobacterium sp. VNQ135 TaxID=3400922 RepID=UPI003BFBA9B8
MKLKIVSVMASAAALLVAPASAQTPPSPPPPNATPVQVACTADFRTPGPFFPQSRATEPDPTLPIPFDAAELFRTGLICHYHDAYGQKLWRVAGGQAWCRPVTAAAWRYPVTGNPTCNASAGDCAVTCLQAPSTP